MWVKIKAERTGSCSFWFDMIIGKLLFWSRSSFDDLQSNEQIQSVWASKENWSLELKRDFLSWTPSRPLFTPVTSSTLPFLLPSSTPRFQDERLSIKTFWSPPDFYHIELWSIKVYLWWCHPSTSYVKRTLKFWSPLDFYCIETYQVKQIIA